MTELKNKLKEVVELVKNNMVDPDIDIEYCIPGLGEESEKCKDDDTPCLIVTYVTEEHDVHKRKIKLKDYYLKKSPEEIAGLVTFYIEQFKEEVDSVEYGGE